MFRVASEVHAVRWRCAQFGGSLRCVGRGRCSGHSRLCA